MEEMIILNPADLDVFTKSKKHQKELRRLIDRARMTAISEGIPYRYSQGPYTVEEVKE